MTRNQSVLVFSADPEGKIGDDQYCGTSYAARLLGTSVATVQQLVEKEEIVAWKTKGGHRRISLRSLELYQRRKAAGGAVAAPGESQAGKTSLKVLVVEDDEDTRLLYESHFEGWGLPMDVTLASSAMEAIMEISRLEPDVLITDVDMPNLDGLEMLRTFRTSSSLTRMHVLVVTGLDRDALHARGGLPDGVLLLTKPIDFPLVRGYLTALTNERVLHDLRQGQPL